MICETIHLKDRFSFLGEEGRDPTLQVLLTPAINSRRKTDAPYPGLFICPGGGYTNDGLTPFEERAGRWFADAVAFLEHYL